MPRRHADKERQEAAKYRDEIARLKGQAVAEPQPMGKRKRGKRR